MTNSEPRQTGDTRPASGRQISDHRLAAATVPIMLGENDPLPYFAHWLTRVLLPGEDRLPMKLHIDGGL